MNTDHLLDTIAARQMLGGIGHTKFYQLLKDGDLRAVKIGRRTFCRRSDLQVYLDSLKSYNTKLDDTEVHFPTTKNDALKH